MRNMSEQCPEVDDLMKRYFLPVGYSLVFVGGLVGNSAGLMVYVFRFRPWKTSSIIMVNLAVTDLLYTLSMPYLVYYYSSGEKWPLGKAMCRAIRFGFHFNLYGSILFLTCMALLRYVVVTRPMCALQVQQKLWGIVACAAVWVITTAELIPMLSVIDTRESDNQTYCLDFASSTDIAGIRLYSLLLSVLGYLLPLLLVCVCYIGIVLHLQKGPHRHSSSRRRARRTTVLILVVFVVCFLPYHILRILYIELRNTPHLPCTVRSLVHAAYIISRPVAALNTFFNLALYTLSGDTFKKAFVSLFCCECWGRRSRTVTLALISNTVTTRQPRDRTTVPSDRTTAPSDPTTGPNEDLQSTFMNY